ncbi:MAG: thioredoxin family protein [Candidatus Verstraetearchaeota archaeon]|nr:thioredoxin family protein [Candidatus Verstraetearchaeota archaeon]
MPGVVTEITDRDFEQFVKKSPKAVVEFWDPWCSICQEMAPVYEGIAERHSSEIAFARLNMRENRGKADEYGVYITPTFIFYKLGREIHRIGGLVSPKELEEAIMERLFSK